MVFPFTAYVYIFAALSLYNVDSSICASLIPFIQNSTHAMYAPPPASLQLRECEAFLEPIPVSESVVAHCFLCEECARNAFRYAVEKQREVSSTLLSRNRILPGSTRASIHFGLQVRDEISRQKGRELHFIQPVNVLH